MNSGNKGFWALLIAAEPQMANFKLDALAGLAENLQLTMAPKLLVLELGKVISVNPNTLLGNADLVKRAIPPFVQVCLTAPEKINELGSDPEIGQVVRLMSHLIGVELVAEYLLGLNERLPVINSAVLPGLELLRDGEYAEAFISLVSTVETDAEKIQGLDWFVEKFTDVFFE